MKDFKLKYGPWAIVTGASSGIGKEFAHQLASNGINLVLLARREELLKKVSEELSAKYEVEIKYKRVDLTTKGFIADIETFTQKLDVRLLISNAGAAVMGAFSKTPLQSLESMVDLNVVAQLKISHWFANRLLADNHKGGIILVSSGVAFQGTPYMANYSAAKAYILNLGEALNYELKERGIDVTVLVPGPTDAPGLTQRTDANMAEHLPFTPQPAPELVTEGLKALLKNKPIQIGGSKNRAITKVSSLFMSRKSMSAFWGKMNKKMVYNI